MLFPSVNHSGSRMSNMASSFSYCVRLHTSAAAASAAAVPRLRAQRRMPALHTRASVCNYSCIGHAVKNYVKK